MERYLTEGEKALARSVYGDKLKLDDIKIVNKKWVFFQPKNITMCPTGNVHFHPKSPYCSLDYSKEQITLQALLIHELMHALQTQRSGKYYLPLMRLPFARYDYTLRAGWPLRRYGLEQQARIVEHYFLLKNGFNVYGAAPLSSYESLMKTL